jgi:hypothetical protein
MRAELYVNRAWLTEQMDRLGQPADRMRKGHVSLVA